MRKLVHAEIVTRQKILNAEPRLPFSILLDNIRSLYNVGAVFRIADGSGVEKVWLCGITGYPPDSQINKTALGSEQSVAWEHRKSVIDTVKELKSNGYQIILLEQCADSISYFDFKLKPPVCLVVGNEIGGVSEDLAALADAAVDIKMAGIKNSLNASVACGVVVFHFREQLMRSQKRV
ncbi:MAG: TrmH family RNA methyltransferase [Candidatus Omnitrophica bacterium]|nr:TrmH family RNA methyltransferase [Candidatus Omnitrophota bacterium]